MQPIRPRVFVSYAPEDATFAQAYVAGLRAAGVDAWLDERNDGRFAGKRRVIERELATRDRYVAILSPAALANDRVNAELDAALELLGSRRLRTFLAVLAAPCQMPALLTRYPVVSGGDGQGLTPQQAVARTLQALADPHAAAPRPPRRARTAGVWGVLFNIRNTMALVVIPAGLLVLVGSFAIQVLPTLGLSGSPGASATPTGGVPADLQLEQIAMVSPTEGWAVGDSGVIAHDQGGVWRLAHSPTTTQLLAISMLPGGSAGFAVGNDGVAAQYTQGQWIALDRPAALALRAVVAVSPSEAWVAGTDLRFGNNTLLHFKNGAWTTVPIPSTFRDPVFGNDYPVRFGALAMDSPTDGWVALNGTGATGDFTLMLRYNGSAWVVADQLVRVANLYALSTISSHEAWAVGASPPDDNGNSQIAVAHYDGAHWTQVYTLPNATPVDAWLYSISVVSPSEIWVAGTQGGGPFIAHSSAGRWSAVSAPSLALAPQATGIGDIAFVSSTQGWAIAGNQASSSLLRYQNGIWSSVAVQPAA